MTAPRVLGIDGSLAASGVCLPDGSTYTIHTGTSKRGDARYVELRVALIYYLRRQPVDLAVVEQPIVYQSGEVTIILGMVHGIIREVLAEFEIPRALVNIKTLKIFATGNGSASKTDMVTAANVNRERTTALMDDDNQADAWWLRQVGLYRLGQRTLKPQVAGFPEADKIRDEAVNGPWPKKQGIAWPKLA